MASDEPQAADLERGRADDLGALAARPTADGRADADDAGRLDGEAVPALEGDRVERRSHGSRLHVSETVVALGDFLEQGGTDDIADLAPFLPGEVTDGGEQIGVGRGGCTDAEGHDSSVTPESSGSLHYAKGWQDCFVHLRNEIGALFERLSNEPIPARIDGQETP